MVEIWRKIYPLLAQQIIGDYQVKKGRCVEIGSGDGKLGLELARRTSLHVYMVDINGDVLKKAHTNACGAGLSDRINLIQADVERLPFVDDFADLVVSRGSIFFWNDKPRGLRETYRILKTGGVAFVGGGLSRYISEQEREEFIRARTAGLKDEQSRREWERLRSTEYFRQILRQTGISHFKLILDPPGLWIEMQKESISAVHKCFLE
ncbi:MAG: class I SAM-dependent methyltransferase [Candidatus Poribacteria bacterium]